jgi:4-carboxymuconolactone decarboxylase
LLAGKQAGIVSSEEKPMTDSTTTGPERRQTRRRDTAATGAAASRVRIAPVPPADRSPWQQRLLGPVRGDDAANLFATLVAHPPLFEAWLPFCLHLLRCPEFSARSREMVILRTAWLCGTGYEWAHHVGFALKSGLSEDEIRALSGGRTAGWTGEEHALLDAVDELHARHTLSDATWEGLAAFLGTEQLIVLPMLVGHYTMLAGTLSALGIAIDDSVPAAHRSLGWSGR